MTFHVISAKLDMLIEQTTRVLGGWFSKYTQAQAAPWKNDISSACKYMSASDVSKAARAND